MMESAEGSAKGIAPAETGESPGLARSSAQSASRAAPVRRLLAGAVDLLPLLLLFLIDRWAGDRSGLALRLGTKVLLAGPLVWLLFRDAFGGFSPGKAIFGLRVRDRASGAVATPAHSVVRNVPLLPLVATPFLGRYGPPFAIALVAIHGLLIVTLRRGLTDLCGGTVVTAE